MKLSIKQFEILEWTIGAVVTLLAVVVWLNGRSILGGGITIYDVFPVFGLIAFGLMWTHYVNGSIRRASGVPKHAKGAYWVVSTGLVLASIILHPLLFNVALFNDGLGLPPQSYVEAYQSLAGFVTLGSIALFVFLSFELRRFFGHKSWWKWVDRAQILAMIAIFIHSVALGSEVMTGWFMSIWWFYGLL